MLLQLSHLCFCRSCYTLDINLMLNKLGYKKATLHPFTLDKEDKKTLPYCIKRKIVRKRKRERKGSCKSVFLLLIKCTL